MKLDDILPLEKKRIEKENWNKIYLIKSNPVAGLYEWSAWLVATVTYTKEVYEKTKEGKPINILQKKTKSGEIFAKGGFPESSLTKYIPAHKDITVSNEYIIITIDLPESFNDKTYERWICTTFNTLMLQSIHISVYSVTLHPTIFAASS